MRLIQQLLSLVKNIHALYVAYLYNYLSLTKVYYILFFHKIVQLYIFPSLDTIFQY